MAPQSDDRFAGERLRLRTAFTPSQPVLDRRAFAGRTSTLTTLIRSIEDDRLHAIVYGERGIGKTSLMHVLTEAAREARYLVSYVSCGASSTFDEMFRVVASDIPLLYHAGFGPTAQESERGETIADLLPGSSVSVRAASDFLARVVGTRVLIVLDEFDRVESAEFRLGIAEFIKNLSDRSVRAQLLIAGVAGNLTELVQHIPSIQRSIFALQLPRMAESEVRQLVKTGEQLSGLTFQESAVRLIVGAADGLPYLASLLSHHAGLRALDHARLVVTSDDVAAALSEALVELKGRLSKKAQSHIARCAHDGAAKLLGGLSNVTQLGSGAFSLEDVASIWPGDDDAGRARNLVEGLAADGVLLEQVDDETGRSYRFTEDGVRLYLWLLSAESRFAGADRKREVGIVAAR